MTTCWQKESVAGHAPGLGELGQPDAALDVEVAVVEQRDHADRRLEDLAREPGQAVEGVLVRRGEQPGAAQHREPHGIGQGVLHARAGHPIPSAALRRGLRRP